MNKYAVSLLICILFLVVACAPAQQPSKTDTVNIGFMAPLSGDAASYGLSILKGAQVAVEQAGVTNVKLIAEDSKCDPKEAVSAINKLITVDKVQAIVGEVCSGATLAAAPIAEQNSVVLISSASTSPKITTAGDYIFRSVPSDAHQAAFGAELVVKKYKKLAILYSNEEYGAGFNSVLKEAFPKLGGEIVASEAVERGSVDLRTQLTKIKNSKADAIYIISNSPDSAVAALKQIKELGINAAIFGSEGLKSQAILDGAGNAAEGMILTSVTSGNIGFLTKHKQKYGVEPGPFAAQAHDAFKALALAIKNGAAAGPQIRNELYKVSFDGAAGSVRFDSNGDLATASYEVYKVEKGKFEPQ
ncbi:penicillin-binding protein activator [Candidatus Woesearchaeota archaeon]|nr:penicillin-binding protein activator [Candidatus Woesearchaeota archaeon]